MSRWSLVLVLVSNLMLMGADSAPPEALFLIRFRQGPNWDAKKAPHEQAGFAAHSANLARLRKEGRLLLGARFADTGMVVLRVADETAAKAALDPDPTVKAGVFQAAVDAFTPFYHSTTLPPLRSPEALLVRVYMDAFNRHDPAGIAACLHPEAAWMSLEGDRLSQEGNGREAIQAWLKGYFASTPTVKSEPLDLTQTGAFLSLKERVTWTAKDGSTQRQSALCTFEIRDQLIRRVWYFPAFKE